MNLSYNWLRDLTNAQLAPREIAALLTARAATVDEVAPLRQDLAAVVVARVVSAARHPNSDHLWVTKVDAGTGELLDVVCGAPNVREGALYPFAAVGVTLPGGITLEKRKIRGALSNGMLCSPRELGLGDDHAGIMELSVSAQPGTPLLDALPLGDTRIVLDVTPNRPDLLSHIGVAREIVAAVGGTLTLPQLHPVHTQRTSERSAAAGGVTITIDESADCSRYIGAVIRGVSVGPSPDWLRTRVESIGARSLNNVVDITNLVLHETGQPIHAFDLRKLHGASVVVRRAQPGESIVTLDGVTRNLTPAMTVIADRDTPHAVAGVMGGEESAVSESTTDIFLEVATFAPRAVRATRGALALSTDASYRFERGVDPELPEMACRRAIALLTGIAGGSLAGSPADIYPEPATRRFVPLRLQRVKQLLGIPIPTAEAQSLLESVGFQVRTSEGASLPALEVLVPSWRVDVASEVDLIEEIARLRGYDSFPDELRPFVVGSVPTDPLHLLSQTLRQELSHAGFLEARPLPFVAGDDSSHLALANPIADDERHLRRRIIESLARRAEYNLARMQRSIRIFEVGNIFSPALGSRLPNEATHLALLFMGERHPPHFTTPRPPHFDIWDAKALAEKLAGRIYGRSAFQLEPVTAGVGYGDGDLFHVTVNSRVVGWVTEVQLDAPVWAGTAFGVEFELAETSAAAAAPPGEHAYGPTDGNTAITGRNQVHPGRGEVIRYTPLPPFPAAEFDLALLVPDSTPAAAVELLLRRVGGDLLENVSLFDEYRGESLPAGVRSLAWRLTFRHPERTLRDKEIEGRRQKLLTVLEKELGVRQRSS